MHIYQVLVSKEVIIILNNDIQTIQWLNEKEEKGNNKRNVEKTLHTENKIKQHKPNKT
jgi:hypothetical protein